MEPPVITHINGSNNGATNGNGTATLKQDEFETLQKTLAARKQDIKRVRFFRIVRLVLIAVLVVALVATLWSYFQQVKSYNGFVNGQVYAIRSPIDGTVHLENLAIGKPIQTGQALGKVDNPRAYDLFLRQLDQQAQLTSSREQLANVRSQIAQRAGMLAQFGSQSSLQKGVRLNYETQQLNAMQHSVEAAQAEYNQAQADATRYRILADKGYAPRATAENYQAQLKEAEAHLSQKQAEAQEARAKMDAARAGIQVDGSLTASYPEMRREQLQTELFQLKMQASQLQLDTTLLANKLQQTTAQYKLVQSADLVSPANGIVWRIDSQSGEAVAANKPLVSVLDCNHLWVDAYVDDKQLQHIDTKAPVSLKLAGLGQKQTLQGTIEAIRPGTGRYTVGQNAALIPPDPRVKSQTMIRVGLPPSLRFPGLQSCAVGSAVEASFKRK